MESDWKSLYQISQQPNTATIKPSGYNARRIKTLIDYVIGLQNLGLEVPDTILSTINYLEHEIKFNLHVGKLR